MNEGKLTISRTSSDNKTYDLIRIELYNEDLQCVTDVFISTGNFAKTITGLSFQPCKFEISGNVKEEKE